MLGNQDWNDDAECTMVCINSEGCMQLPKGFYKTYGDKYTVAKGFDKSIAVYSREKLLAEICKMPIISEHGPAALFTRIIASSACMVQADKEGRIFIPKEFLTWAEISDKAEFRWDSEKAAILRVKE